MRIKDDMLQVLTQFHHDFVVPDIERIFERHAEKLMAHVDVRFNNVYTLIDGLYERSDRHESELQAIKAGLARVESQLTSVESRLTSVEAELQLVKSGLARLAARVSALEASEIVELKQQIALLNERVAELEARRQ